LVNEFEPSSIQVMTENGQKKPYNLSSKLSNCSSNIVKRTLEALGRKTKEQLEFIPMLKKKDN